MLAFLKDTRLEGKDEATKVKKYEYYTKRQKETNTKLELLEVVEADGGSFKATFVMNSDSEKGATVTLPVIEENKQLKILVDGELGGTHRVQ